MDYERNPAAALVFLKTDGTLRRNLRVAAREVADMAEVMAPIETGAYVNSIRVEDGTTTDRQSVIVTADDPAAAPIEFGNARTGGRGHNILQRAAEVAGFDVDPGAR